MVGRWIGSGSAGGLDGTAAMRNRINSSKNIRLGKVQPQAPGHRTVFCNDRDSNSLAKYKGNSVSTTKYDVLTFLPKGLFEQGSLVSLRTQTRWLPMQRLNGFLANNQTPLARMVTSRYSCSKLFVGGLCYDTNEPILKQAFEQHGEIIEAKVICDHKSGKSKGYGFVKFTSETAASKALKEMDNQLLNGRSIRVSYANKE